MTGWYSVFLEAAWKSVAVLAVAWLITGLLRGRSAAARHIVWTAAFAALLALPLLSAFLPRITVAQPVAGVAFRVNVVLDSVGQVFRPSAAVPRGAPTENRRQPVRGVPLAGILWALGAGISLTQMGVGWWSIARARRHAGIFPGLSIAGVRTLKMARGSMPMTFGILNPVILLPANAVEWSAERLRVVLQHELAHIERSDVITHLLVRLVLSFYWWNPLAWFAWRQFLRERECAADDFVLRAGAKATEYAGHLLEIAHSMQSSPALGWAAVGMARRSQLEGRLAKILASGVNRSAPPKRMAWIAALLAAGLIAPLAALRAQDGMQTVPADADATIRAAMAQRNHEMLDSAAKAAEVYRQFDLAKKLLESSLTIREQVSGPQGVDYGLGLIQLGDLERGRRSFDEAKAFYTKAVNVLANRPEAAKALLNLGTLAMRFEAPPGQPAQQAVAVQDLEPAFDYFQRAQVADPAHAGPPLMWMAVIRQRQTDAAAAEQLFKQALAAEKQNSANAAPVMRLYAAFLKQQGRNDESQSLIAEASQLSQMFARPTYGTRSFSTPLLAGNGVTPPALLQKIEPEYTEEARLAKYQGTVVVAVVVGTDGTAQNMRVIRSLGLGLDEKAMEAISQWKFKPGTKDGQPVQVAATIEVNFRLL
ncbi:MAG: TonB family protein [Acidobacteriia bacterium]|nr:TonB family protein [Terriglobia bacterium]